MICHVFQLSPGQDGVEQVRFERLAHREAFSHAAALRIVISEWQGLVGTTSPCLAGLGFLTGSRRPLLFKSLGSGLARARSRYTSCGAGLCLVPFCAVGCAVRLPRRLEQSLRVERGGNNVQVDCCCWLCLSHRNIGASNDTRADSSAERHDHKNRCRLRAGYDTGQWCLRR
jgi:hypothetical protein